MVNPNLIETILILNFDFLSFVQVFDDKVKFVT